MTEIVVEGELAGLAADHPAVLGLRAELLGDLKALRGVMVTERDGASDADHKGVLTDLMIGLTSAGSLTAFVQFARVWLGRDQRRSLTVRITEGNSTPKVIRIEGEKIATDTLTEALRAASAHEATDVEESSDQEA
ncbi:hypothetical protein ACFU93_38575 [Streptomyces sp. NPDC057611]|uniref:hypothetical protein n=1 Tax=Streptomyces sp. NPDC057611 TaxID=3346182 RepID=UPI0036AD8B41